jgi:TolA-binding protein
LLAGLGLLAGGAVAGALLAGTNDGGKQAKAPPVVRTRLQREVRTITTTLPGTTVSNVVTVTTSATAPPPPPPPATPPPPAAAASSNDGHTLNDRGFALMQQGRYSEALAPLEQAVRALRGTGPSDPYEAYANFNLGFTLLHLGQCSDAIPLFDRAEQLEGHLPDIVHARNDARKCLRAGG